MGTYLSRQNDRVEEINSSSTAYTYPPKSGGYFSDHFYMGGKKFDTAQPEGYLFGDNSDLNYLGPKPQDFPFQLSDGNQPIRALKCLVNIRKDSIRLVRAPSPPNKPENVIMDSEDGQQEQPVPNRHYNIEFTFDADCPCSVTVYYNATEEMCNRALIFTAEADRSDTVHFNSGCNQQFCLPGHIVDPSLLHKVKEDKNWDRSHIPIALQICAKGGPEFAGHSHVTYALWDKASDGSWNIKAIKQKQVINGLCYLFQEIYGIENKAERTTDQLSDGGSPDEDDDEDDNSECVVCLSDMKDTLILPCKHLCLCSACANQLRFQQSGCPICRQSFRALLQIRAVRKVSPLSSNNEPQTLAHGHVEGPDPEAEEDEESPLDVSVPPGYEVIPLVNAINGPVTSASFMSLSSDDVANRSESMTSITSSTSSSVRRSKRKKKFKTSMGMENEVAPVDDCGNHSNEGKKPRSRRSKKVGVEQVQRNVVEESVKGPSSGSPLHFYVNDIMLGEEVQGTSPLKGAGDHELNPGSVKVTEETASIQDIHLENSGDCQLDFGDMQTLSCTSTPEPPEAITEDRV